MNFNHSEFENENTTTRHERSGSEIIFEGSTLAQYLQEQEDEFNEETSELKSFSEQTLTTDYFPSLKNEVSENEEKSSEFSGEGVNSTKSPNFSSSNLISNLHATLKSTNITKSLKDLITASSQINTEFYNLIDDCIEKIEFIGWLNSSNNNWKLNTNLVNFENYMVSRPKTLNLLPMAHRYYLSAAFMLIIALLSKFGLSSYFLNYSIILIIGVLTLRFYNLNLWYSNLTGFCQNLNQFLQIYLELDKDFKQIIQWASEIELVSKGFRSGIKHDYSSSSIDEESRELLMDSIQKLRDTYLNCQFRLIKEFDLPYTCEELENLQNLPALEEEFTWLSRIKFEYEKLFVARKTLLNLIFNLVKFNLVDLKGFLKFFNNNFNQLSLTGNGIKIQLKEVFNINSNSSSPNTSVLSHSFDNSLLRHHRKKSSMHSTCSTPDEEQMNTQIKLNKSLNSLEMEMRTWFAKFHVINTSISNISQSTTLKNDPEEIQKAIDSVINEFKQMTQSIAILSESSKRSEQLLKDWSESFNNHNMLSPSLTLIEEEELNASPNVNDILELTETREVFDCEADKANGNLENLFTNEPECYEVEAQPLSLQPELVKSKLTREERIKQMKEKRKSENRQTMSRPSVTVIVQELNSAIKNHQLKMESIRIKPQRPRSMPPIRDKDIETVDNTDDNLRPNTPVNFESGDSNSNLQYIAV